MQMQTQGGFAQIPKDIQVSGWYCHPNSLRLYLHLMLTVNFRDMEWRGVLVRRGQRLCSYETLGAELGISLKAVRYAAEKLKRAGELAHSKAGSCGVFTLLRYDQGAPAGAGSGVQTGHPVSQNGAATEEERKKKEEKDPPVSPRWGEAHSALNAEREGTAGEEDSLLRTDQTGQTGQTGQAEQTDWTDWTDWTTQRTESSRQRRRRSGGREKPLTFSEIAQKIARGEEL